MAQYLGQDERWITEELAKFHAFSDTYVVK